MKNALGLPEFIIDEKVHRDPTDRALFYDAVKEDRPTECPRCQLNGPFYSNGPGEPRLVQDLSAHGKLIFLKIEMRRWKCRNPDCGYVFSDFFESIDGKSQMTRRLRDHIRERSPLEQFSQIAREYSLSEGTVRLIFNDMVDECEHTLAYKAPRVLGIDEAHLDKKLRTVITDTENNHLLDILPHRDSPKIIKFLKSMDGMEYVKVVTMDMYEGFRKVVHSSLPWAHIVVDHYHVIQLANDKMDEVRRDLRRDLLALEKDLEKRQKELKAKDSDLTDKEKKILQYVKDSLYRLKQSLHILQKNREDLKLRESVWLKYVFQFHVEIKMAYYLKELVRRMYKAKDRNEAGYIYLVFKKNVPDYMEPFKTLEGTIDSWAEEIFNFFDYPFTNAYAENRNGFIKRVQEDCRALKFEQLRYKVLFASRATKLPKFRKRKAEWHESDNFGHMMSAYGATVDEIVEGFYVDIDDYLDNGVGVGR
jgi:transposase